MSRFSRFLNLEHARKEQAEEDLPQDPSRAARFGAVETAGGPDPQRPEASATAEGHLARFQQAAPRDLDVDTKREVDQPFVRCALCEGDNTRFAAVCQHCQADLNTAQQRAFNEALWLKRQAVREEEKALHARIEQARLDDELHQAKLRREAYEALARDVGRRTRAQFEDEPLLFSRRRPWRTNDLAVAAVVALGMAVVTWVRRGPGSALALLPFALALGGAWALLRWRQR